MTGVPITLSALGEISRPFCAKTLTGTGATGFYSDETPCPGGCKPDVRSAANPQNSISTIEVVVKVKGPHGVFQAGRPVCFAGSGGISSSARVFKRCRNRMFAK